MRLYLLLFLFPFRICAQQQSYVFQHITSKDGLAADKANCIFQDSRGFYWIGTDNGLQRFDGKNFSDVLGDRQKKNNYAPTALSSPLLEDKEAYRVKERESVLPAEGEVTREKEREPVMDNMRMKKVPVAVQDDIQTQMRTRVKYVTREIPVLQDLIEEEQVVGKGPADEKSMVSSVRAGKVAPPAPGIVKHHNTLNVLNNNIIPAPERQTIHVSIGRIEIKAVAPPVETKAAPVKKDLPIIGLDQYLEQRNPAKR